MVMMFAGTAQGINRISGVDNPLLKQRESTASSHCTGIGTVSYSAKKVIKFQILIIARLFYRNIIQILLLRPIFVRLNNRPLR